jgi:hypothetical protein
MCSFHHVEESIGGVSEHVKLMIVAKVPEKAHEEPDVSHRVQQVLVLQLVRSNHSKCLLKVASAGTCRRDELVGDHLARLTPEVLHLVADHAPVKQINQAPLDAHLVQRLVAVGALPSLCLVIHVVDWTRV